MQELTINLDNLHTTELGTARIKRNLNINDETPELYPIDYRRAIDHSKINLIFKLVTSSKPNYYSYYKKSKSAKKYPFVRKKRCFPHVRILVSDLFHSVLLEKAS